MKALKAALLWFLLACLLYAADYISVRYRFPKGRQPFATVEVQPYYAVPLKDGKTEFIFLKPETQVCVNSLFPQLGHLPCWYLRRKRDKRIDI